MQAVIANGSTKEIADLVSQLQGQQCSGFFLDGKALMDSLRKASRSAKIAGTDYTPNPECTV